MFNYISLNENKCEFFTIAPTEELADGERLFVEINNLPIVIFNISGKLFAIGDVCSHDDGPLGDGDLEEDQIICPRHGARFDVETGKALTMPAVIDIPAYPVRVTSGQIEIGIPQD
jgi:3-phenylpropionate/trans-cinnamate dioxygenase ferredoxin subunit